MFLVSAVRPRDAAMAGEVDEHNHLNCSLRTTVFAALQELTSLATNNDRPTDLATMPTIKQWAERNGRYFSHSEQKIVAMVHFVECGVASIWQPEHEFDLFGVMLPDTTRPECWLAMMSMMIGFRNLYLALDKEMEFWRIGERDLVEEQPNIAAALEVFTTEVIKLVHEWAEVGDHEAQGEGKNINAKGTGKGKH